jgi:hypothetical protein
MNNNKELYNKTIDLTKIVEVKTEPNLTFIFKNGKVLTIGVYHNQSCCETVYADFEVYKYIKDSLVGKDISNILIKGVEDMGFLVCLGKKEDYNNYIDNYSKVFVPCYNCQNGYYSSDLELQVSCDNVETKVDISDLAEEHID